MSAGMCDPDAADAAGRCLLREVANKWPIGTFRQHSGVNLHSEDDFSFTDNSIMSEFDNSF